MSAVRCDVRVSVFGLGYVGIVSAACLARDRHSVVGVDPQDQEVGLVNSGQSPIVESSLPEPVEAAVASGALRATRFAADAVASSDLSLVCVGTPSRPNRSLDTSAIERLCEKIGAAFAEKGAPHLVAVRSPILPRHDAQRRHPEPRACRRRARRLRAARGQ